MANLYVIRFSDGKSSSPITADEIKKRIQAGQLNESDELSLYPNVFSLPVADYPEFEKYFTGTGTRSKSGRSSAGTASRSVKVSDPTRSILIKTDSKTEEPPKASDPDSEETRLNVPRNTTASSEEDEKTKLHEATSTGVEKKELAEKKDAPEPVLHDEFAETGLRHDQTLVLERPKELLKKERKMDRNTEQKRKGFIPKKSFLVLLMLGLVVYEFYEDEEDAENSSQRPRVEMVPIRPRLPSSGTSKADPQASVKIYEQGLGPYFEDTVQGYRKSSAIFHKAIQADPENVKALALLASSYLNLIESSNKDESTYTVINKLIELSGMKKLELVETLLAEVEFLAAQRRYDAAIQRLVDYTERAGKFDPALYFYLAWLFSEKGDYGQAMKYLNLIPNGAMKVPRLFYLRGFLHEANQEYEEAEAEYNRALAVTKFHAKSRLGLVRISDKKGELKRRAPDIRFLLSTPSHQSPKEYVQTLIYASRLSLLAKKPEEAVLALENAIEIEPNDEGLRLEYYTLLANSGKNKKFQKLAQMYALVMDGDRNAKAGKIHEAQAVFIQAQDTFPHSSVPFEKMADLFVRTGEFMRAQQNYKKALEIDPKSYGIAIRLIDSLIQNHDWDEAEKVLGKYRSHPKLKSAVDRLAGDLAYRRGNYSEAVTHYRKAMSRDSIDTEVYSAYANLMREADQCRDAQFFYSLAQKLDPFSLNAIMGSAKCLLKTDGVSAAVSRIQGELSRWSKARVDLLVGVAEIYLVAHEEEKSLQFIEQAKSLDPDYPETYRIEGEVYLRQMIVKKSLKSKALDALKAYSDRKPSDPSGYLKRFEIFISDSDFEKATQELGRVFELSPNYPELHYKRALMYSKMGRNKDALSELQAEIKLNPRMDLAYVEQGDIYSKANDLEEAMKSYAKAMEINPKSIRAKIGAGTVSYLKRQYTPALALFQAALAMDKGNPEIYKKIGLAFRESGDVNQARQAFQNYLDLAPDAPDRADYEAYKR